MPLLAVYLRNKYPEQLFHHKDIAIDAILHYLNEFTELNGGARYRRIKHLEQYLFLIEKMMGFFSYSQGKYLINIFNKLIGMGEINISKVIKKEHLPNPTKHDQLDRYENNFIVYSASPVKDCVLIMYLCRKLEEVHQEIKNINQIYTKYSKVVSNIIDATESIKEVYIMLTEKLFNNKEVIDIISS